LPDSIGRRRAVPAVLTALLLASLVPALANATTPAGLEPFLYALGQVESGGSYTAYNSTSGAYGKYQIIPSSWAAWAKLYLGSSTAPKTPANQETVAHRKVTALYNWLDSWPVVAHWWLTGSSERNPALWSSFSRTYVNRVISLMKTVSGSVGTTGTVTTTSTTSWITADDARFSDSASAIAYHLTWRFASYRGYSSGHVKYATTAGATATLRFSGKGIAWVGPTGPTRGSARVYIDGRYIRTVDLRRSTFHARSVVFSRALAAGTHTLVIRVVTGGKPVAIDELIVGR
jgi:Transglycosylase-like domain